jgi:thymidylate synthase (FAD)
VSRPEAVGTRNYCVPITTNHREPNVSDQVATSSPDDAAAIEYRSDVTVELVKASASDSDVLFAARVSTVGERSLDSVDADATGKSGLIRFLMRERHGSPFEHSVMTFYVEAPIFVWREHMRHRMTSYNEESGRYRVLRPVFYIPARERKLVQIGKAGAYDFVDGTAEQYELVVKSMRHSIEGAYAEYQRMLDAGVAREVARTVLPVSIYSSAYVTMNARALMNFISLRKRDDAATFPSYPQREIEMVAERYEQIWADLMPVTHEAFVSNGRVAP